MKSNINNTMNTFTNIKKKINNKKITKTKFYTEKKINNKNYVPKPLKKSNLIYYNYFSKIKQAKERLKFLKFKNENLEKLYTSLKSNNKI